MVMSEKVVMKMKLMISSLLIIGFFNLQWKLDSGFLNSGLVLDLGFFRFFDNRKQAISRLIVESVVVMQFMYLILKLFFRKLFRGGLKIKFNLKVVLIILKAFVCLLGGVILLI